MEFFRKISTLCVKKNKFQIFKLIAIPASITLISIFMLILFFIAVQTNSVKNNYNSSLRLAAGKCENEINRCIEYISSIENNSVVFDYLRDKNADTVTVQNELKNISSGFSVIDSVIILNKKSNTVISKEYYTPSAYFYNDIYRYSNYDNDYWTNLKMLDSSPHRVISPSVVTTETGDKKTIIPIVFRKISDKKIKNYLIVNLSLDMLFDEINSDQYTKNTGVYVLNLYTGQTFCKDTKNSGKYILETPLYTTLSKGSGSFKYTENGKKFLVCAYSSNNTILGYTYFSQTPYSDIWKMVFPSIILSLFFIIVVVLITYILTLKNSVKIMRPLEQLATTFSANNKLDYSSTDLFEYLESSAKYLVKNSSDFTNILPYAQEKYLINYLNSADYTIDESSREIITKSLPFKNRFFTSLIIQVYPTNLLYDNYSTLEYINIQKGIYNIVKEYFRAKFDTFIISSEKETLYIIINSKAENPQNEINSILNSIKSSLVHDSAYIELFIGLGNTHHGLDGLKISHSEALNSLKIMPKSSPKILFSADRTIKYVFSNTDEVNLLNSLLTNDSEKAAEIMHSVLKKNENIDYRSMKQIYSQILNTILKAMRIKKISFDEESKYDFEISSEILNKSPEEIHKNLLSLLSYFSSNNRKDYREQQIVDYINENYTDSSLSLEAVAQYFDLNSSYLSVLLKKYLSIGFHDYLNNLRINAAKKMLTQTNKSIQDIFKEVGFNNKQTFVRVFKSITHVTPSEYRKNKNSR